MDLITDPQVWLALLTLTALEIVLGIDNIIFITILVGKLPPARQPSARFIGLGLAMFTRIALLLSLTWIMGLTAPLFSVFNNAISWRDLILLGGGAFLLFKSTLEIHESLEGAESGHGPVRATATFLSVVVQIAVIDIVFSLDSVITAIGLARDVEVMIVAIVIAVIVMMVAAAPIGAFVDRHPTIKMLALSFLILIGVALIAEALEVHIPRGYLYFAMAFSVAVEMLNIRVRKAAAPVHLRKPMAPESADQGS